LLPWSAGQSWHLWFGPHNTNSDSGPHPFTSLDFAGGDGVVRAAAGGVVYRPCANLVVVDHGGGWETGYYHMPTIYVQNGQTVTAGQALGTIGTAVGCGGVAHGAHVHFSVYHFSVSGVRNVFQTSSQDMDGLVIGGWVVHDGARSGLGYMQRLSDGAIIYPSDTTGSGLIANDGTAGGSKPTTTPTGYATLAALNVRSGPGISYSKVGSLANGTSIAIACQTKGDSVNGSTIWDQLTTGGYISDYYVNTPVTGGFSPGLSQCQSTTGPTGPTAPTGPTGPTTPPNREAITSYDRMAPGAPYHGFFYNSWQPFAAQSNTITHIGVTVGTPGLPAGQGTNYNVAIHLCDSQPDANGNCAHVLGQGTAQIVNYGNSYADIGDVAVAPGTTYWAVWFQPPAVGGSTWVTYWWAGGPSIGQSDQMQMIVKGYNR
jgi:hypothetical protein